MHISVFEYRIPASHAGEGTQTGPPPMTSTLVRSGMGSSVTAHLPRFVSGSTSGQASLPLLRSISTAAGIAQASTAVA